MIRAVEYRHGVSSGDRARQAQRAEDRLRACVAKNDARQAGQAADLLGHLARQGVLGTDLVARPELRRKRLHDEGRGKPEEVRAKTTGDVRVLIAVDVGELTA